MEEKWLDIKGYEGIYQVSNKGRVRSLDREIEQWNGFKICRYPRKGKIIKGTSNGIGYTQVQLTVEGKPKRKYIHRLVIEAFKGESVLDVNHIDHIKTNNFLENLEYVTKKENSMKMSIFYGTTKDSTYCNCGEEIYYKSKQCRKCETIDRSIDSLLDKPSLGTLLRDVHTLGYESTGRKYNVSGNSIKNWIKQWHKVMDE